jgi:hypothetical protein
MPHPVEEEGESYGVSPHRPTLTLHLEPIPPPREMRQHFPSKPRSDRALARRLDNTKPMDGHRIPPRVSVYRAFVEERERHGGL